GGESKGVRLRRIRLPNGEEAAAAEPTVRLRPAIRFGSPTAWLRTLKERRLKARGNSTQARGTVCTRNGSRHMAPRPGPRQPGKARQTPARPARARAGV